jgi:hypothetical protein
VIRSASIAPSATYESGHFYFAQTGHSHFAATALFSDRSTFKWKNCLVRPPKSVLSCIQWLID